MPEVYILSLSFCCFVFPDKMNWEEGMKHLQGHNTVTCIISPGLTSAATGMDRSWAHWQGATSTAATFHISGLSSFRASSKARSAMMLHRISKKCREDICSGLISTAGDWESREKCLGLLSFRRTSHEHSGMSSEGLRQNWVLYLHM